jgi:hypothetical protein
LLQETEIVQNIWLSLCHFVRMDTHINKLGTYINNAKLSMHCALITQSSLHLRSHLHWHWPRLPLPALLSWL